MLVMSSPCRETKERKKIVAPTFKTEKKKNAQLLVDQRGYLVRGGKLHG